MGGIRLNMGDRVVTGPLRDGLENRACERKEAVVWLSCYAGQRCHFILSLPNEVPSIKTLDIQQ